jgi:hypothetical protein
VRIIIDPGSVCQRWMIQAVAPGEKVVAITSSLPKAWLLADSDMKQSEIAQKRRQQKSLFVIPFINTNMYKK